MLLHEMIHVWTRKNRTMRPRVLHGAVFKAEAKRVGASVFCRSYAGRGLSQGY